jgi:hypothetical protein
MSEELQVSEWDNFTPEQKHLLQVWIKSLEECHLKEKMAEIKG